MLVYSPISYVFQSTLPHGSDIHFGYLWLTDCNFNPRSLTGATDMFNLKGLLDIISIHAPSRERLRLFSD